LRSRPLITVAAERVDGRGERLGRQQQRAKQFERGTRADSISGSPAATAAAWCARRGEQG